MLTSFALATLLTTPLLAQILPTEPGPGSVFNEGGKCTVSWNGDPEWAETNIQLMTGDNFQMVHLSTIATVDGSEAGSFEYDCLDVEPNSQIYFYQFSTPASSELAWTGRWAIADAAGGLTEPTETNTPTTTDGVQWGTGRLVDPAAAVAAPDYLGGAAGPPAGGESETSPAPGTDAPETSPPAEEEDPAETGPTPPNQTKPTGPPVPPSNTEKNDAELPANTESADLGAEGAAVNVKLDLRVLFVLAAGYYVTAL